MYIKETTKKFLSDYVVRLYKYWLVVLAAFGSWYMDEFAWPIKMVIITLLVIKAKDLVVQEMRIEIESGISSGCLRALYIDRALTMLRYVVISGVVMSVVDTAEQMDIFYWLFESSDIGAITLHYIYSCFMRNADMTLTYHGMLLGWVLLCPILSVLFQSDGDAYLILQSHPLFYFFGGRDITLHFRDPLRSIDNKKDRIFAEVDDYIKVVSCTDFHTMTLKTHVASERIWTVMKPRFLKRFGVQSVNIKAKEISGCMYLQYILSIYFNVIAFKGKRYKEYRELMDRQKLENNHVCLISFKAPKECEAT